MSDTSSISSANIQSTASSTAQSRGQSAEIIRIPAELETSSRPQNIRGDVTRVDSRNTATINTDRGEIVVRLPQNVEVQRGDTVQVQIPAGEIRQEQLSVRTIRQDRAQETTQPQRSQNAQEINLPAPLSEAEILNSPSLEVTQIPARNIDSVLTPSVIETEVNQSLFAQSLLTSPLTDAGTLQASSIALSTEILNSASFSLQNTTDSTITSQNTTLNVAGDNTAIPFRAIAVPFATSQNVVSFNSTEIPIQVTEQITQIQVQNINVNAQTQASLQRNEGFAALQSNPTAIIAGFTPNQNFAVFQITSPTHLTNQHYALNVPTDGLPIGAQIEIDIVQSIQNNTTALAPLNSSYFLTPEVWPIFQELNTALLNASAPQAQIFNAAIPTPANPSQFGAGILFFVAAVRSGDIQGWLGEKAIETLKRAGKADIIGKLARESTGLARMNAETISGDWRALSLPLAWDNEVHKIALYYRNENDTDNAGDQSEEKGTRFIMDLNLSNMGKLQLDGLFTGSADSAGRLDLVLRSEEAFSQSMRQQMRSAYKTALAETRITGDLAFQNHLDQWVRITPDEVLEYEADV